MKLLRTVLISQLSWRRKTSKNPKSQLVKFWRGSKVYARIRKPMNTF
jgi:hypothetical protein